MSWPLRLCLRWRASTRDLGGEEVGPLNTFPTTEHTSFHSPPSFSFPSNILLSQLLSCRRDLPPTCVFILAFLFLPLLTSLRPPSSLLLITVWLIHSLLFPFNKRCRCTTTDLTCCLPPALGFFLPLSIASLNTSLHLFSLRFLLTDLHTEDMTLTLNFDTGLLTYSPLFLLSLFFYVTNGLILKVHVVFSILHHPI